MPRRSENFYDDFVGNSNLLLWDYS